ncbi:MAG: hypothetical protein NZ959_00820, partial [Armatimonadetes bacterium]|nr:hypothetical protein [Armatimonadota bacterium]
MGKLTASALILLSLLSEGKVVASENFPPMRIANDQIALEFSGTDKGVNEATILIRRKGKWAPVAHWRPILRIVYRSDSAMRSFEPFLRPFKKTSQRELILSRTQPDEDGAQWRLELVVQLDPEEPVARIRQKVLCDRDRSVLFVSGPDFTVSPPWRRVWGLLPGLEFLFGDEPSSNPRDLAPPLNERRIPNPKKVTIPLMAVTVTDAPVPRRASDDKFFCPDSLTDSPTALPAVPTDRLTTLCLFWDPLQKWDGERTLPSLRFESPVKGRTDHHRFALFLPSCPDFVKENEEIASQPYPLRAHQTLSLEAVLSVEKGPILTALSRWLRLSGGLPSASPPRSFQEELNLGYHGLMTTVWDPQTEKWRHCIDWAPQHSPGFATLLWFISHLSDDPVKRDRARERVQRVASLMLQEGGPALFIVPNNCHILRWEFPFRFGHLAEALPAIRQSLEPLLASQKDDGSWRFQPDERTASLGRRGDAVLGTMAHNAALLARYARITGDARCLAAAEKALLLMERFRVPRGGQTWECPMYEPDILPAGWAVAAYCEAFLATGKKRWLHNALYWAETGIPFVYLWSLPDRPMMLGATIPVFGSTFYTHSWLGMPVQWCGLVYAYHIQRLAKILEKAKPAAEGSPLFRSLNLTADQWRHVAKLITISAQHQEFADGPRIGTYPDSITDFRHPNGPFINPEDILVNVLTLSGYDP